MPERIQDPHNDFFCFVYVGAPYNQLYTDGGAYHFELFEQHPELMNFAEQHVPMLMGQVDDGHIDAYSDYGWELAADATMDTHERFDELTDKSLLEQAKQALEAEFHHPFTARTANLFAPHELKPDEYAAFAYHPDLGVMAAYNHKALVRHFMDQGVDPNNAAYGWANPSSGYGPSHYYIYSYDHEGYQNPALHDEARQKLEELGYQPTDDRRTSANDFQNINMERGNRAWGSGQWHTSFIYIPKYDELVISPNQHTNHWDLMRDQIPSILRDKIFEGKVEIIPGLIMSDYDEDGNDTYDVVINYSDWGSKYDSLEGGDDKAAGRAAEKAQEWLQEQGMPVGQVRYARSYDGYNSYGREAAGPQVNPEQMQMDLPYGPEQLQMNLYPPKKPIQVVPVLKHNGPVERESAVIYDPARRVVYIAPHSGYAGHYNIYNHLTDNDLPFPDPEAHGYMWPRQVREGQNGLGWYDYSSYYQPSDEEEKEIRSAIDQHFGQPEPNAFQSAVVNKLDDYELDSSLKPWNNGRYPVIYDPEGDQLYVGQAGRHHLETLGATGLPQRRWYDLHWGFYMPGRDHLNWFASQGIPANEDALNQQFMQEAAPQLNTVQTEHKDAAYSEDQDRHGDEGYAPALDEMIPGTPDRVVFYPGIQDSRNWGIWDYDRYPTMHEYDPNTQGFVHHIGPRGFYHAPLLDHLMYNFDHGSQAARSIDNLGAGAGFASGGWMPYNLGTTNRDDYGNFRDWWDDNVQRVNNLQAHHLEQVKRSYAEYGPDEDQEPEGDYDYLGAFVYDGVSGHVAEDGSDTHFGLLERLGANPMDCAFGWIFEDLDNRRTVAVFASMEYYTGDRALKAHAIQALQKDFPGVQESDAKPGMNQWNDPDIRATDVA